jgi:hypothetical protein
MTTVSKVNHGRKVLLLVAVMLALAALACGGGSEPEPTEPPEPPPTEAPTETPEPVGGSLKIVNESGDAVCFVYISPAGSGDRGNDQLGEENVIEAGGVHTINNIPPGTYDIWVDDCNQETIYQQNGAKLGATDFTLTVSGSASEGSELVLENTSGVELCYLFIVLPTDETWGQNWLDDAVPSGSTYTIQGIHPDTYDLRVETCESDPNARQYLEEFGVDLTGDSTWTIKPAKEGAKLILVNNSGALLCYLYVVPPDEDTWGRNWLPEGSQISTGSTFTLTNIPPGSYDLRVETCESDPDMRLYYEQYGADIQTEFTLTINPINP